MDLFTVQVAQLKYLQKEHAAVLVKGTFDDNTSKIFRTLQRNTSGFTEESLLTLNQVVNFSAAQARGAGLRQRSVHGNQRWQGRGRFNRGGFNRHDPDLYSNLSNRDVGTHRPSNSGDQE